MPTNRLKYRSFARWLRALIISYYGGSQRVFSIRMGVTFSPVNRWCSGQCLPSSARLVSICKIIAEDIGDPWIDIHSAAAMEIDKDISGPR